MLDLDILFPALLNGLIAGAVYVLVAVGLTLIYGVLHIINFAHGSLLMLAMYAVFLLDTAARLDPLRRPAAGDRRRLRAGLCSTALVIGRFSHGQDENILLITLGLSIVIDNAGAAVLRRRHADDRRALCRARSSSSGRPAAAAQDRSPSAVALIVRLGSTSSRRRPARRSAPSPRSARARGWSASTSTTSSPSLRHRHRLPGRGGLPADADLLRHADLGLMPSCWSPSPSSCWAAWAASSARCSAASSSASSSRWAACCWASSSGQIGISLIFILILLLSPTGLFGSKA